MKLLFPRAIDNVYRGQWAGLVLFSLFLALTLIKSANSIVNTRAVATGADSIPLDTYGPGGAEAVLTLFALTSVGPLVLVLLSLVALARYRAMIPLLLLVFLAEHVMRRVLVTLNPIERSEGTPVGFYINLAITAILLVGLLLSLWTRRKHAQGGAS